MQNILLIAHVVSVSLLQRQQQGEPSLADIAMAHPLWFLRGTPVTAPLVDAYPDVAAWLARVLDFGHGSFSEMSAADAIEVARDVASEADFDTVLHAQMPLIATPFMGLPGLTVTTGRHGTAPVGVQLIADQFREDLLLAAGEHLSPHPIPAL